MRRPVGPIELLIAAVVALDCLALNAAAVAHVPELSREDLGPLALAYHDRQPNLILLPMMALLLLLGTRLPAVGRIAVVVFVGAAVANLASPSIWEPGVPDYIVFRDLDVIANVSDLLMIVSAAAIVLSMAVNVIRRARRRSL